MIGDSRRDGNDTMARRESEVRRSFPASADAVSDARVFVDGALAQESVNSPSRDVAVLLVSELATNAVEHAHSAFSVSVHVDAVVRIEVADAAAAPPVEQYRPVDDVGGRGLRIVDGLADAWGTRRTSDGKVVWFELEGPVH